MSNFLWHQKAHFVIPFTPLSSFFIALPKTVQFQTVVTPLLAQINTTRMTERLNTFTSFTTRYYLSETGKKSSEWLFGLLSKIIAESGKNISVEKFDHRWKNQFSIIARFEPSESTYDDTVIVGAHQDSINGNFFIQRSPGADDDGSGSSL